MFKKMKLEERAEFVRVTVDGVTFYNNPQEALEAFLKKGMRTGLSGKIYASVISDKNDKYYYVMLDEASKISSSKFNFYKMSNLFFEEDQADFVPEEFMIVGEVLK